ncbi:casein kinase ii subunit beta [Plakobranchus ocellatus]|uniref:Casein kinase ii subunit beta n=1 Tax=Plakobranchus ocellatus TaxID=259542 RepID=A0AAV4DT10_9GAST|nr:casein kinase ii subunit beta [Plakobranchus ocellatus]
MNKFAYLVALLVLLIHFELSSGIWCFICHTNTEPACGDDFRISLGDADKRMQCDGSCIKRRGKRKRGSVSRTEIQRSCRIYGQEGCYTEEFDGISQYTCLCNSNFCNGSPSKSKNCFTIAATVSVIAAVAVKIYADG